MTPAQIEEAARRRYNAVDDTNWTTAEFLQLMDAAGLELAAQALCIESVYTTTTVAGQQEYSYPTNAISVKRVTYDGMPLDQITFREDDAMTGGDSATTSTGIPRYYSIFNDVLYLRAIPSDALSLKIFCYSEPQPLTATATLEIPTLWHMAMVDYILSEMYAKDKDFSSAGYYRAKWDASVLKCKVWMQKKKRGGKFGQVQEEETLSRASMEIR